MKIPQYRLALAFASLALFGTAALAQKPDVSGDVHHDVSPALWSISAPTGGSKLDHGNHNKKLGALPVHKSNGGTDPVIQTSTPNPALAVTGGVGWTGVGVGFTGPNGSFTPDAAPPDTEGAVGKTQYVQWVNESFAVFDKATGTVTLGPVQANSLWAGFGNGCETNNDGDPIVQYDRAADRWIFTQFSVSTTPYLQCVAVSTTPDATGSYNRYAFQQPDFNDYPKLGVWPDGYYTTFNMFSGNSFLGGRVCAFDRSQMLVGAAATQVCFQDANDGGFLPSDWYGATPPPAGAPDYIMSFGSNSLNLYKFHVDFTTPSNSTFTGPTVLPVAAFSEACGGGTCIPQEGTSQKLDSLGDRLMYRLTYRNFGDHEAMVVNHSVTAGSSVGVRWYEIRNPSTTPVVYQQGTFAPDSNYRWMGSVAIDAAGDIAMGYSESSSSMYPSIAYTGRTPADPLNTMEAETSVLTGTGSQNGGLNRWGDYSAMSVDPVDDCTFWYTNEYLKTSGSFNWSTYITSFKFPGCSSAPDFSVSATPASQTVVQGSGTSFNVSVGSLAGFTGTVTFGVTGLPSGATPTFTPTSVSGSGSTSLGITTASNATTGSFPLTITATSGSLSHTAQVTLVVNALPTPDFSLTATPASQTVIQGNGTSYTASVTPSNGFSSNVALSITSALPTGVVPTFNPTSISSGNGSSTLGITTTSSTPPGTYTLTINGTGGSVTHTTNVTLVVNSSTPPDFSLSASPASLTVPPGSSSSYTVSTTAVGGFSGAVSLSVSGLPSRVSGSFNPSSISGSGSSTLTISANRRASNGTYTLTITGISGGASHTAHVTLVIGTQQTPGFSLTASPGSQTVVQGNGTSYTVTVTPSGGFSSSVALSNSALPAGVVATFNPTSLTSGSSSLTITTSSSTPAGTYPFTITGTGGGVTHTANVTLVVNSPTSGDFSISANPASVTVSRRNSGTYTVSVAPTGGFSGSVALSVSGIPNRSSGNFSPSTISGSGSSTLTISTSNKSSTGTFSLTITGTSGAMSHSTPVTLTIQ